MTAPNEPGALSKGDGPNADGLVDRGGAHRAATGPGRIPDAGDPPPWQRAATRQSQAGHRQPPPVSHPEGRPTNPPAAADARLNRFISGASAPVTGPAAAVRTPQPDPDASLGCGDGSPAEAYASELPDLSGPTRGPRNATPRRRVPRRVARDREGIRPPVRAAVVRLPLRVETPVSSCRRGEAAGRFEPACRSDGLIHGAR